MQTFHFTSVVSSKYVYKFLAMQSSLKEHCTDYHLYVLCVDPETFEVLERLDLSNVTLIAAADLEKGSLYEAKCNRNYHEYCWTLKPFFLNYVMQKYRDTCYFAQLDSDLYFYSDPLQIINEAPTASMFLTDHNFSIAFLSSYETSGKYNTGFVGCRNDETANTAVTWWLEKCFEKCSLIADADKEIYGDQRYAEKWPLLFPNVHIVKSKGANVAQWNIGGFNVFEADGEVFVEKDKLIFHHFSGLEILDIDEYSLGTFFRIADNPLKLIYMPYINNLSKQISLVKSYFNDFNFGFSERIFVPNVHRVKI